MENVAFGVLQEYARSGVFEAIYLVDRTSVETLVGDVSIHDYEQSISHFISYIVAMVNFFSHTESILSNKMEPSNISRLATFGVSSLEEEEQDIKLLFPLQEARDIHFFYGIPKQDLADDPSLTKKIKAHVKSYKEEGVSTSFSVYPTSFDKIMVICVAYSSKIQNVPEHI